MGRIKKDHSGYRTHGIFLKYQNPKIEDKPISSRSKKNTRRWCKGKVGKEHELYRYFLYNQWSERRIKRIRTRCSLCYKDFTYSGKNAPLYIDVDYEYDIPHQVQVKVNGKAIAFTEDVIRKIACNYKYGWCNYHNEWHY